MVFCSVVDVIGILYDLRIDLLGHVPSQMGQTLVKALGISMVLFLNQKGRSTTGILFANFFHHSPQGLRNDEFLWVGERPDRESLNEELQRLV